MSDINQDLNPPSNERLDVPPGHFLVISSTKDGVDSGQTLLKEASFAVFVAASLIRRSPDQIVRILDSEGNLIFDSTNTDVWDPMFDPI
jgi:hypothetical protein